METVEPPPTEQIIQILESGFNLSISLEFVLLGALLVCSALISGSEAAFFSLNPSQKEIIANASADDRKLNLVQKLLNKPQELLATILVTNNFVNVAIVILSSTLLKTLIPQGTMSESWTLFTEVVLITFVLLLIGEVIPKIYATKNALKFSKFTAKPLDVLRTLPPISWVKAFLVNGSNIINKRTRKKGVRISSDELEKALALTKEDDTTDEEQKLLEGIVKFGNTEVRQIMRSRMDVCAIDINSSYEEVLQLILKGGYSRIPVFKDSIDEVVGILCIKDLLGYLGSENTTFDWTSNVRKPFFVPENKKIDDLLKEFQGKKVHMAVVVDEYGGASGICTLEDILEEIVGDITDEFDDDELVYTQIDPDNYLFEGKTALVDIYKVLDIDSDLFDELRGDADTLGGFVVENAGRIPKTNEYIDVQNIRLTVESSDKKRVKMVKITVEKKEENNEN
jgi:putative hemolysin